MSEINKVILIGHLGKDPDFRTIEGGVNVAGFPLATSEFITKNGVKVEQTEWHNIVMWRSIADVAEKVLYKGLLIYLEGKVQTRSFTDKQGANRYITEVIAYSFTVLGSISDLPKTHSL